VKAQPEVNLSSDASLDATARFPRLSMMRPRPVFFRAGLHQRLKASRDVKHRFTIMRWPRMVADMSDLGTPR
jgi:hypothetical protein